ncbi:hypothetical protein BJX66DRAFT_213900 [Aspergillus keveii]|uniref:Secreted protein n=1 Tax=Aspergillus keveii TaxID=714993 RepID=A0ABR4GLY1_9EURO
MFQELLLGLLTTLSRAITGILSTWPRGYREEATRQDSGKRSGYASRSVGMSFACKLSTVSLPPGRHQATPSNWARFFCNLSPEASCDRQRARMAMSRSFLRNVSIAVWKPRKSTNLHFDHTRGHGKVFCRASTCCDPCGMTYATTSIASARGPDNKGLVCLSYRGFGRFIYHLCDHVTCKFAAVLPPWRR